MRVIVTRLPGVFELHLTRHEDERGFFARLYCEKELFDLGAPFVSTQINLSRNPDLHTLRGMHFQEPPYAEAKIVRAVRGSAFDVAVDLRRDSPTFGSWTACELSAAECNALLVPEGFAHGFLTLEPDTDILYQMSRPFAPGQACGIRYDDPDVAISWPAPPAVIGAADLCWPSFAQYLSDMR